MREENKVIKSTKSTLFIDGYCKRCGLSHKIDDSKYGSPLGYRIDELNPKGKRGDIIPYEYLKEYDVPAHCPICYGDIFSFLDKSAYSTELKYLQEFIDQKKEGYYLEFKQKPNSTFDRTKVNVADYISNYVCVEKNIIYFTKLIEEISLALFRTTQEYYRNDEKTKTTVAKVCTEYPFLPLQVSVEDLNMKPPKKPELIDDSWLGISGLRSIKKVEQNTALMEEYEKSLKTFEKRLSEEQQRVSDERKAENLRIDIIRVKEIYKLIGETTGAKTNKIDFLREELDEAVNKLREFCRIKSEMLSMDIIYPKYCEFTIMATLDDYFKSKRVSELEGPYGAYNLYENELRANMVISKLEDIIGNLEAIKANQYSLYEAISGIETSIDKMSSSIGKISKDVESIKSNSAAIAYNTEKTARYAKVNAELTGAIMMMTAFR